jgi:methylaspartate ammonia-lyase
MEVIKVTEIIKEYCNLRKKFCLEEIDKRKNNELIKYVFNQKCKTFQDVIDFIDALEEQINQKGNT